MASAAALSRSPLVLAVAALAFVTGACGEDPYVAASLETVDAADAICTECGDCEQAFLVTDRRHLVRPIEYPEYPPPGGPHDPCWADWGVHDAPVATARWVHNLEHGGIVYLYDPDAATTANRAELTLFAEEHGRTLLAPSPELTTTFAALAWGHRILSSCVDMAAVAEFRDERFAQAPEDLDGDPPASCR